MTLRQSVLATAVSLLTVWGAHAQVPRLSQAISDSGPRVSLRGTVSPRALHATDLGELPDQTPVESVYLHFSLTDAQDSALTQLLNDQQNPASPRYHQWITPEQYAAQFGMAAADLKRITAYLTSQGLAIQSVARSRSFVTVSGTAGQIRTGLGTALHAVSFEGEQHYANLTEPQLPAALAGVISGITGLHDFRLKPRAKVAQVAAPSYSSSGSSAHYLAPGDMHTIYDIKPLLANAITGAGVTIAVMGQTDISFASAAAFRAASGLPANPPVVKLYGLDPGTSNYDLPEAMLDIEWAGAIAPAATILYVNSRSVIVVSLTNAIDDNLAPILSVSYGDCEKHFSGPIDVYNQFFRHANVQGQTIITASGDTGATDCDYRSTTATQGLAVDFPASSPSVTAIGGTMFHEGAGTYFNTANGSNSGSAISYIPETVWNETAAYGGLAGGGGGASDYFTKPVYQIGNGVPDDYSRDVPDISLASAFLHDGYVFCTPGYCTNGYLNSSGYLTIVGGTSVATPQFAGMLALLEQKIQARVGNANPVIYGLANSSYSTAVFHDITLGNNAMPCSAGSIGCPSGGSLGYNASTGYDLATGWGSVDAFNLVSDWLLVTPAGTGSNLGTADSATTLTASVPTVTAAGTITLTASVASATTGVTKMPSGTIQFLVDNVKAGSAIALVNGSTAYALYGNALALGPHTVLAAYSGDSVYAISKSSVQIMVLPVPITDFRLSAFFTTATTKSGTSAPGLTFTVASLNGFSGPVAFAATSTSTTFSSMGSYAFNPAQVVLSVYGGGSTVLTLSAFHASVQTGTGFAKNLPPGAFGTGMALAGMAFFFLPTLRRRRWSGLLLAALAAGMLTLSGCSAGPTVAASAPPINTPAGTYTVLVTATGTSSTGALISHDVAITFVVQ